MHAHELVGHVDGHAVDRLVDDAVDLPGQHLRLADGELEALAAHHLDEHGELQLAATLDLPRVGPLGRQHPDADVADELGVEAVLDQAGRQRRALLAGQRRRVDADRHRQARVVDVDDRQRPGVVGVGERLADRDLRDPGDGDDLARPGLVGGDPVEGVGDVQLGDPGPLDRAVGAAPGDGATLAQRARPDAAQRQPADVRRGVEVGDERLQRHLGIELRGRDALDEEVHQRVQAVAVVGQAGAVGGALERRPCPRATRSRRSGSRAGRRRRRGRGTAPRRRGRPRRCGRRGGRPC